MRRKAIEFPDRGNSPNNKLLSDSCLTAENAVRYPDPVLDARIPE
jgi:hypothetical protein